ncbi:MAG: LVIVD repeat-containing protein, partial [Candidatus Heimdallarchaeaceae archaeon]
DYANDLGLIYGLKYSPHKRINSRPDYVDIQFDADTAYKILFDAKTADGHDYSIFTGEAGSVKYFLDLMQGLDYDASILTINVEQKLADIYDIDTPEEIQYAKSFAAYLRYLTGEPALNWLYENKISYIAPRTTFEWIMGVPDPLMGGRIYPLVSNDTVGDVDLSNDLYYAIKTGQNDLEEVDQIIAIANIPCFENSQSYKVEVKGDFAYVVEGNKGFRIVNISDPLFLGIGGYRLQDYSFKDIAVESGLYGSNAYVASGTKGILSLDLSDPTEIEYLGTWTNMDKINALDLEFTPTGSYLLVASGEYGVAKTTTSGGSITLSSLYETTAPAIALTTDGTKVYVVEEGRGIEVLDLSTMESLSNTTLPNPKQVLVDGSTLYVIDGDQGLVVFNINGNNLELLDNYDFGTAGNFNNMYMENDILYLAAGEDGLLAIDASNVNSLTLLNTYDSEGSAYDAYVSGEDIYLADGSKGLLYLTYSDTTNEFSDVISRDELRTYVEIWNKPSFVQLNNWPLKTTQYAFNVTYGLSAIPPRAERGFTQRWVEYFYRPFIFDSSRDTTLFYDDVVYIYFADTQQPYLQVDQYDLYWQEYADYLNESFIHVGRWNKMYNTNWKPSDIYMTHTFPGSIRDEFHFQILHTEPTTGTIIERRDRVQYNTYAGQYIEFYPYLNDSVVEDVEDSLYQYRTWHQTYPKLTADMANLFWQEDITKATKKLSEYINNEFLGVLRTADSYRTGGAFGALFILTMGLIVASMTINMEPVIQLFNRGKK